MSTALAPAMVPALVPALGADLASVLTANLTGSVTENPLLVILRFVLGMAAVFLLMWLLYRYVRKANLGDFEGPGLRVVSRLPLSRSAQVVVIEIGGRMFLVGAGDDSVTPIAELYDTDEMAAELEQVARGFDSGAGRAGGSGAAGGAGRAVARKPFGQVLAKFSRSEAEAVGGAGKAAVGKDRVEDPAVADAAKAAVGGKTGAAKPVKQATQARPTAQSKVSEAQMDALAAQIAAEFGVKKPGGGA